MLLLSLFLGSLVYALLTISGIALLAVVGLPLAAALEGVRVAARKRY